MIPYSGKFSHGANFYSFGGWANYRKNKSLTAKLLSPYAHACRENEKCCENEKCWHFFWSLWWDFYVSLHQQNTCYTVLRCCYVVINNLLTGTNTLIIWLVNAQRTCTESYCSQFVCVSVTNLALAYDVCATNWTYQPGLRLTPKVSNLLISLKSFLSRVLHVGCFLLPHGQGGHFQSLKLPYSQFNRRP